MKTKTNNPTLLQYLKNPFEYIAGAQALIYGSLFLVLSIVLGIAFNARFDGLLNLHFVESTTAIQLVTDQLINYLSMVAIFFLVVQVLGAKQTRFIDLAGTLLLAMAPFSITPLLNINNIMYNTSMAMVNNLQSSHTTEGMNMGFLVFSLIIMLLTIVWMVALMFQAYKICSNFKGTKLTISFIIGLVGAAILSKYLVILIS